jgi:peroxiredoxin
LILLAAIAVTYLGGCALIGGDSAPVSETIDPNGPSTGTAVGNIASEFTLDTVDGLPISTKELQGRVSVLVFWTAWCPVCREEAPAINKLNAEFKPKGVNVIGINIGESDARIAEGVKDFGIEYTVAKDKDTAVARKFKVVGTPTIVFLDRAGKIAYVGHALPGNYPEILDALVSGKIG